MQISLLKTAPSFDHPLEILTACHGRITGYLEILEKIGEALLQGEFSDTLCIRLKEVLRYFETGGVHHIEDEEESLFPRLLRQTGKEAEDLVIHIQRLTSDLDDVQTSHQVPSRVSRKLVELAPKVDKALAQQFSETIFILNHIYLPHIEMEDKILFPFASAKLSAEDLLALGREMAQRRGIDPKRLSEPWPKTV